jgi:hypothetical protein
MRNLICGFWRDESGSVFVGDWVFVATILVLGAVTGMVALHHNPLDEVDATAPAAATTHSVTAPAADAPAALADGR